MQTNYPSVAKACTSEYVGSNRDERPGANKQQIERPETTGLLRAWRSKLLEFPGHPPICCRSSAAFGPQDAANLGLRPQWKGPPVNLKRPEGERRKWPRLPLAIPVFVRSRDEKGKELLEFATALNVSAGGMLLAVRRVLPSAADILLEIPSAPLAALASLPRASRNLRARSLRSTHAEGYHLLGLKFSRPLPSSRPSANSRRRKSESSRKLTSAV
jgi:hypothetical protein